MALVVSGQLNKHIAVELGISQITIEDYPDRTMRQMQAHSLAIW
jgi:FixJ family two-component response regulator